MGRLGDHPNIMQVFALGNEASLAPGGQPYMVLPLMPGGDVEGVIEKATDHKMPLEQALRIANEVCRGLEFAHSKGIIHRDLKPDNVWLTQDGTAKIGDFGLALPMNRSRLTTEGMMVVTVAYMPPEQAMGGDVTPQADLYSLGCMMYEMTTGRPPFVGDGPVAIIGQHLNTPPVAPSWHRPDCPPALESIILRLLEKDPTKRPHTARDVREALEAVDLNVGAQHAVPLQDTKANPLEGLARGVFVDRTAEMATGRAIVDEALSGRAGFLLLNGEIGIGKTRLAEEICTYASLRGAAVLWGVSLQDQGAPAYWPWVQALRTYVRSRDADRLRSELGTVGPEMAKVVSDLRDRLPNLPPPTPGNPAEERFRLFDAVASFLRNASASQPLVVVLDNLHLADQPTLLLAQFLLQKAGNARLLLIGTYREMETGRRHPHTQVLAQLALARRFRRMTLTGLSREDAGRLMETITGEVAAPALLRRVYEATGGVPLFVEETVRLLAQQGR
ncbi:MAG: hypothetical protein EXR53_05135, partial [Dehalococcoidia bacterium]|nr:hypothetical protein [Dehalococcoidia bacterium]